MPKSREIDASPLSILFPALLVMGSVAFRRNCIRPGGMLHRWNKKQRQSLVQSAALLVLVLVLLNYLVVYLYFESHRMALGTSLIVLFANALDQWLPPSKKEDILEFKKQLRQSLAPARSNDGDADSDSSESYDMERHGAAVVR